MLKKLVKLTLGIVQVLRSENDRKFDQPPPSPHITFAHVRFFDFFSTLHPSLISKFFPPPSAADHNDYQDAFKRLKEAIKGGKIGFKAPGKN